jgi:hypothetical protein
VELQVGLKVVPTGVVEAGAWNYAFTYELFQRWFPEVPGQARAIKRGEARRVLVQRYLDNVVAADRKMIAKVFHVLKWTSRELDRTIAALLEEGAIQEVQMGNHQNSELPSSWHLAILISQPAGYCLASSCSRIGQDVKSGERKAIGRS